MADIIITRGMGLQDDYLDVTNWTLGSGVTLGTDGDIASLAGTTASNGATRSGLTLATDTYPKLRIRGRSADGNSFTVDLKATFSDTSTQTFTVAFGAFASGFTLTTATFTPGKTLNSLKWLNQSATPRTAQIDFILVFKELLILPAITQPLPITAGRIVAVLPILQREGEIIQDLGSKSPELVIQGALVSTTTPTNHTAAEWWDLLEGLVLEGANETWQWLSSDRVNYKYLVLDLSRSEILSRKNYYEFSLRLKRFDMLSQTADRLGIVY